MVYDDKISVAKCFGVNPLGDFSVSVYVCSSIYADTVAAATPKQSANLSTETLKSQ